MSNIEFNQLLVMNADFLKPVAITLARDPQVAADLYQETVYKALANRDKYNTGTNIRAWLYTIMRNVFINNYRRKVKQRTIFDNASSEGIVRTISASPMNAAEGRMELKVINEAIRKLPKIFRDPFMLYFDGYKYHDIAEMLKEPLGTIKSRIHFARKLLKSQLERH